MLMDCSVLGIDIREVVETVLRVLLTLAVIVALGDGVLMLVGVVEELRVIEMEDDMVCEAERLGI